MIKTEERSFTGLNNRIVPAHWSVRRDTIETRHPKTQKIIAIGNGDDCFRETLLDAIKNAKSTIMLCSFILSDEDIIRAILHAQERQVRCYVLFSTEAQLKKEYQAELSEYDQTSLDNHKRMLDRFAGKILARTNDHLHAKYLLVDIGLPTQKGFISTANFTREALSRNQEIGIILNDEEMAELFDFFRRGFWFEAKQELIRQDVWDPIKTERLRDPPQYKHLKITSSTQTRMKNYIMDIIRQAKGKLYVSSYGFDPQHEVVQLLTEKAAELEIIVLTRPREKNSATIKQLKAVGAEIRSFTYLHSKFIFCPKTKVGIIMTANLEPRGIDEGYEVGVQLDNKAIEELQKIVDEWYEQAPYQWETSKSIQELSKGKILIPQGRDFVERMIEDQEDVKTSQTPQDLTTMQELMELEPDLTPYLKDSYSKKVRLTRTIHPPSLPPKADKVKPKVYHQSKHTSTGKKGKPRFDSFPVPVYRWRNRYYAVIKDWKEFRKIQGDPSLPSNAIFVSNPE